MISAPTPRTELALPDPSLVLLVGASGCGKSTFARRCFRDTEIVSSDRCRALVSDDENDQGATRAAFRVLHVLVEERLRAARFTVVDATNVRPESRRALLALARDAHLPAAAIVFALPDALCLERARTRADRSVDAGVVQHHLALLERSLETLPREGFRALHVLRSHEAVDAATVVREPLPVDRRHERGPFDVVGDVHGCLDELHELLDALGYVPDEHGVFWHPAGRRLVFLGDLADRGPKVAELFDFVMRSVRAGAAFCVPGNHDDKLRRWVRGRRVRIAHGLQESIDSLLSRPPEFRTAVADFIEGLPSHLVFDGGALVVAHAGIKEPLQGRDDGRVRDFTLYGETTGETDEFGLPVRLEWALDYHGRALVVYGHTPVNGPRWAHNAVNIDTGCVFGGRLSALRYPERQIVSVAARRQYTQSRRPFLPETAEGYQPGMRSGSAPGGGGFAASRSIGASSSPSEPS
jgi:protein phosphatase